MAKCPVCKNENTPESISCGRCGCRLANPTGLGQESDFPTLAFNMHRGSTTKQNFAYAGGSQAQAQAQALPQKEKPNFKAILGTAGLLLLLFAVGFGIANSAVSLTLKDRQNSQVGSNSNKTTGTQPVKEPDPDQDIVQKQDIVQEASSPAESKVLKQPASDEGNETAKNPAKKKGHVKKR